MSACRIARQHCASSGKRLPSARNSLDSPVPPPPHLGPPPWLTEVRGEALDPSGETASDIFEGGLESLHICLCSVELKGSPGPSKETSH